MNFAHAEEEEVVEDEQEEGKIDPYKYFNWHCMDGLSANMSKLSDEFSYLEN